MSTAEIFSPGRFVGLLGRETSSHHFRLPHFRERLPVEIQRIEEITRMAEVVFVDTIEIFAPEVVDEAKQKIILFEQRKADDLQSGNKAAVEVRDRAFLKGVQGHLTAIYADCMGTMPPVPLTTEGIAGLGTLITDNKRKHREKAWEKVKRNPVALWLSDKLLKDQPATDPIQHSTA